MITKTAEIADGIFRLSTCVPGITPDGFTFNQFLIRAEEPLLFHTGPRAHVSSCFRGCLKNYSGREAAVDHVRSCGI